MNTNEIPTPITDALETTYAGFTNKAYRAAISACYDLERQLAEARDLAKGMLTDPARAVAEEMSKVIADLKGQRNSLRDALKACREDSICQHQRMLDMKYAVAAQQCEENIRRADEILKSLKP